MRPPRAPSLDERRAPEFSAELEARARAWISGWGLADGERDFGRALLEIAARFNSEVAERLDDAGEKMRRGFLDWLAVQGEAARPARIPVVFKLSDAAQEGVLASAPVRLQADAAGTPVVFETEKDVRVVPSRLAVVVGVDAGQDAYYLPPPGLSDLQPLEPLPTQWQLKSFASAKSTKLQLDPETGVAAEMIIEVGGAQYRIIQVDNGIVTIEPGLDTDLEELTTAKKVVDFSPFGNVARNRQEHALYLGHMDLLSIDAEATIEVIGAAGLMTGVTWEYWGKVNGDDEVGWQPLTPDLENVQPSSAVLKKPKGSIEPREINGRNSRWIRAFTKSLGATLESYAADEFSLRVNSLECNAELGDCRFDSQTGSPLTEAMANTTPLVLEDVFFPLGKEPRQFDAFYLGCQEAFSKKAAEVQLCFKMAEPSFAALSSVPVGPQDDQFLAGQAADGCLHLFRFTPATKDISRFQNRVPLRPPSPGPSGVTIEAPPVMLDPTPAFRAPVWKVGTDILIAVSANKSAVWIWKEDTSTASNSGWQPVGLVGVNDVADASVPITGLVYLGDGSARWLFALRGSKLYVHDVTTANLTWQPVKIETGGVSPVPVKLSRIAPIRIEDTVFGAGTLTEGMVGISANKELYVINEFDLTDPADFKGTCTKLLDNVDENLVPAAVRSTRLGNRFIAVAVDNLGEKLLAYSSVGSGFPQTPANHDEADLDVGVIVGNSIDVNLMRGHLYFGVCVKTNLKGDVLTAWSPFDPKQYAVLLKRSIPAFVNAPVGAPTLLPNHVLLPATSSQVIVATFDLPRFETLLRSALITNGAASDPDSGDQVAIPVAADWPTHQLAEVGSAVQESGKSLFAFGIRSIDSDVFVYPSDGEVLSATIDDSDHLEIVTIGVGDPAPDQDDILLITTDVTGSPGKLHRVVSYDSGSREATLDPPLIVANPASIPPVSYRVPKATGASLLPLLHLDPATTGNWKATLLDQGPLIFPGANPERMDGKAFKVDSTGRPELVTLASHWTTPPPDIGSGNVQFLLDVLLNDWVGRLGDTVTNPVLSWEYWNGKGWWKLHVTFDGPQNLKTSGAFRFEVPDDIASSDWAGKENFWIRARLIGGDYGKEKVTVTTTTTGGVTVQTVDRSPDGIRAPSVVRLDLSYRVCKPVQPTFVLAQDSGSIRDQSDANRTAGAIVEAFVPLALTLDRLSKAVASTDPVVTSPNECDCHKPLATEATTQRAVTQTSTDSASLAIVRELFIGLTATPSEAPVNVLMLVDERDHTAFAPMTVEALVADRFVPIVVDDATRALGESGLLSMAFAIPPTPSELFGKTLIWLRLIPKTSNDKWFPALRGAYLNAVWASATESLTRELLGSSDGSPNLTVRLARPPVLRNTLELRVREPLGDEERKALLSSDTTRVLSDVDGLPGDWVLWKQVIDPDDELPTERAYALDESNGEIRFGDGQHGCIPPIGRDSIVAFRYCRTESDPTGGDSVPANTIAARTALNLVSPVESVESVIAADQAAGGAPAESDDRVLRFGFARLRHRNRAVTAIDLEDLVLQSSPDIVQARAFVRRGYIRLVVVMRGKNPTPNASQIRELRRLLVDAAPASLSVPNALRIEGPEIRKLRIELTLRVETLDHTGQLSASVKKRLVDYFDTATGGADKDGWPLGAIPSEDDIAFAISDAPFLEAIEDVKLREVTADGKELPSLETVGSREIVMLADDPIRIVFETAEVTV
ncbi:MAG: hypothetical protein AABP62_22855 [Planctomycetota bacterium]